MLRGRGVELKGLGSGPTFDSPKEPGPGGDLLGADPRRAADAAAEPAAVL